jgi:hypothetical protein
MMTHHRNSVVIVATIALLAVAASLMVNHFSIVFHAPATSHSHVPMTCFLLNISNE